MMARLLSLISLICMLSAQVQGWGLPNAQKASALSTRTAGCSSSNTRLFMSDGDDEAIFKGTVKWFDSVKGFGFISPDDEAEGDIFVHQTAIQASGFRSLSDGENVEFRVEVDPKNGRRRAAFVTGPGGVDVQGAPYRD